MSHATRTPSHTLQVPPSPHTYAQISPGDVPRLGLDRADGRRFVALIFVLFRDSFKVILPFFWWSPPLGRATGLSDICDPITPVGLYTRIEIDGRNCIWVTYRCKPFLFHPATGFTVSNIFLYNTQPVYLIHSSQFAFLAFSTLLPNLGCTLIPMAQNLGRLF